MNQSILENSFRDFLKGKGLELEGFSLQNFPDLFIEYFQEVKFDGFSEKDDGDMLLFQYGNYDSNFSLNFTRQLFQVFEDECHQILQLSLTFYYNLVSFSDVTPITKWSLDCVDLNEFKFFIINSEGFIRAISGNHIKIEFEVDLV